MVVIVSLIIGVVHRKVGINPYFDVTVLIDTDLVFLNLEVFGVMEDIAIPFKGLHKNVKIIRVRYITNLTNPCLDMLDINVGHEAT